MIRRCYFSAVHCTVVGLLVWILGGAHQAHALEDEQGPFLKNLLKRARDLNYQYSSDPQDLTDFRWESAKVFISDADNRLVLTFDYQGEYFASSSYYREHILNLEGPNAHRIRQLIKGALPDSKPQRQIFLRSISNAITQNNLLAMDMISYFDGPNVSQWMSRLYLMMESPKGSVQFLPAEITNLQEGPTAQHLPLVSLELSHIGSKTDLHYLRYLVPAHMTALESDEGPELGIDMQTAYEILEQYRRFAVTILPSSRATVILPSVYDGRDVISDVALEVYALSSYIQSFLQWYTAVWWAEFPLADSIVLKHGATESKGLELNLYRYRAHACGETVTKDLSSH